MRRLSPRQQSGFGLMDQSHAASDKAGGLRATLAKAPAANAYAKSATTQN